MTPKRIGFVGFDRITGLHLVGPADVFGILSRIRAEFWSYA